MVCFNMTTKTKLSNGGTAQRDMRSCSPRATRSLGAPAAPSVQGRSSAAPPRDTEFLIANLELEFELNHRKESPLKISNRKYLAIFLSLFHPYSASISAQSSNPNSNIHTIRILTKPRTITTYAFSNRNKIDHFAICLHPRFSPPKGTSRDMIPALTLLQ
jgi:hypothetical protein